MPMEIPVCKKCCLCLPLRCGLLLWGYFKLFLSGLTVIDLYFEWKAVCDHWTYISTSAVILAPIGTITVIADIIFGIIFIVGCHQKNVKLLKVYYIYAIVITTVSVIIEVYLLINTISVYVYFKNLQSEIWMFSIIELLVYVILLMLQIYILILVKNEIIKLNDNQQCQFTKNTAEAECTLEVETVDNEDETEYNDISDEKDTKPETVIQVEVA